MTTRDWQTFIDLVAYGCIAQDWAAEETQRETDNIAEYLRLTGRRLA